MPGHSPALLFAVTEPRSGRLWQPSPVTELRIPELASSDTVVPRVLLRPASRETPGDVCTVAQSLERSAAWLF